jgi:16S rRNA (cytosine967-C5)-methyltransferase
LSPARAAAFSVLVRLERTGARFDASRHGMPEVSELSGRDAALAYELITGTIKRRATLDAVLAQCAGLVTDRVDVAMLTALRLGAYQLLFLDRVPAHAAVTESVEMVAGKGRKGRGFANAVLRRVAADGRERLAALAPGDDAPALALRYSYPRWIAQTFINEYGATEAEALLASGNEQPERCLRVNTVKTIVPGVVESLRADGLGVTAVDDLPDALIYDHGPLEATNAFRGGWVTPQSRGSQLAAIAAAGAARPGLRVADLCAAPGTKTAHLAAQLPGAQILAVDVDETRCDALRRNLRRLGVAGVDLRVADVLALDPAEVGSFDRVLVDAPCSGLGTLASRPDLRWRRQAADIGGMAALQLRMLTRAAALVGDGGALTYAVCTVTRDETTAVVDALMLGGEWRVDDLGAAFPGYAHPHNGAYLLTLPSRHGTSGFFIARMRRAG